jgi:hypothetical protein
VNGKLAISDPILCRYIMNRQTCMVFRNFVGEVVSQAKHLSRLQLDNRGNVCLCYVVIRGNWFGK